MRKVLQLFWLLVLINKADLSFAQAAPAPPSDTIRTIEIIRANVWREITVDSVTKLEVLVGDVFVIEGTTKFYCDSAIINRRLKMLEAFGNVRINQGDSVFTSAQYIKYLASERIAYLKRNVKLTDKKATLTTQDLEYNLTTGIGKYINGGKVVNGKTVLTSMEGVYYEDTKDVYFINKVDVVDPKNKIKADSLLYNTQTQKLNFIGPTNIKNKDGDIFTTQGTYDINKGSAFFGNRSLVKDTSGRVYQANNMAFDDSSGQAQLEGNAIIRDSANRFIVTGGQIFMGRKDNSFLATKKPVLIFWEKNDTTYVAGDTLFSGFAKKVNDKDTIIRNDSSGIDSTKHILLSARLHTDSVKNNIAKKDSSALKPVNKTKVIMSNESDTTIRYFQAYHNVRIFNDSLQAVCDSLFYSGADSVFRLFHDPVVWSGNSQVKGDTIFLYTKNKKAERVYVFESGIIINKINSQCYDQVEGKTLNGYFKDGVIDYIRSKGSPAESIYYLLDKDSAFIGMNRAEGSVIDMYFISKQLNTVKFLNDINGKLYPMRLIPPDRKFLKKFAWLDKRRPKNKLELFE